MSQPGDDELHIASFVIQHRIDAAESLATAIAASPELELAIPGETRSVVLCESADRYAVMDRIEQLRAVPGVLNVLLVYHHAEPRDALEAEVEAHPESNLAGVQP